jgi:hypothetical protein
MTAEKEYETKNIELRGKHKISLEVSTACWKLILRIGSEPSVGM